MTLKLLALPVLLAATLHAQTTSTPTTPNGKPTPTVKKVSRPPASIAAPAQARLSTAARVAALSNKPPLRELPAFNVADRDGKPLTSATVPHATHWFLLVREANCLPCDRLMNGLAASTSSELTGGVPYVIVVDGKTQDALERVRGDFPALSQATWLVDKGHQAIPALKARGTPVLYALEGTRIVWNVPGTLANPALVEKMAAAWMTTKPLNAAQTAATQTASTTATTGAAASQPASSGTTTTPTKP